MDLIFKRATVLDMDGLAESRDEVLRAVYGLGDEADLSAVEKATREYYAGSLADGNHTAYLIRDGERFVGTGGISYYRVMPTWDNPTGWKAFIMNMYVRPEYRRKGIATRMLGVLLDDVKERGITHIGLEASEMGRPLYARHGFTGAGDELQLILPSRS